MKREIIALLCIFAVIKSLLFLVFFFNFSSREVLKTKLNTTETSCSVKKGLQISSRVKYFYCIHVSDYKHIA